MGVICGNLRCGFAAGTSCCVAGGGTTGGRESRGRVLRGPTSGGSADLLGVTDT